MVTPIAGILGLFCLLFMVLLGVTPLLITYLILRKSDPEHALKRSGGLGILSLGSISIIIAMLAFVAEMATGDQLVHQAEYTPNSTSMSHMGHLGLGPLSLSVWLLLSGAAIAFGLFLFLRQFSLRSLLIGLGLVALLASVPHLTVQSLGDRAMITVDSNRAMNSKEWQESQQQLTKEALCANLPPKLLSELDLPPEQIITEMELTPLRTGGENTGAQLELRFSEKLSSVQTYQLFDHLCEQAQVAIPGMGPTRMGPAPAGVVKSSKSMTFTVGTGGVEADSSSTTDGKPDTVGPLEDPEQ